MPEFEFFVPAHIESLNRRQAKHWAARSKKDKERQLTWCALINTYAPAEVFVHKPHQRRRIALCVVRRRLLDYDNLVAGLKPFIDVLRCRREAPAKGMKQVLVWEGVIWDDSPKYVKWDIDQRLLQEGDGIGVHVRVDIPEEKI